MDGWWALSRETCPQIDELRVRGGGRVRGGRGMVVVPMRGSVEWMLVGGGIKSVTDYQTDRLASGHLVWLLRGVKEKERREGQQWKRQTGNSTKVEPHCLQRNEWD